MDKQIDKLIEHIRNLETVWVWTTTLYIKDNKENKTIIG